MQPNENDQSSAPLIQDTFVVQPTNPQAVNQQQPVQNPLPQQQYAPAYQQPVYAYTDPQQAQPVSSGDVSRPAPSGMPLTAKVALPVLVLLILGMAGYIGLQRVSERTATNTAHAFISDLNAGHADAAYKLTSKSIQSKQSLTTFASNVGNVRATKPKYLKQSTSVSGQTASFTATEDGLPPTTDGSTQGVFLISMVKTSPVSWKVDSVAIE